MNLSEAGLGLLLDEEGAVAHWYQDVLGVWTIGVGHVGDPAREFTDIEMRTRPFGQGQQVRPGRRLSQGELIDLLRRDIPRYVGPVDEALHVPVPQEVFDVLVSFAFNWGVDPRLGFPATSVAERVNAGDLEGAAVELETGRGPSGRPYNKGLASVQERREREAAVLRRYARPLGRQMAPGLFVAVFA
jgi:lysozyme